MKGPFERLKYDLRRQWECPVCHRKERSSFTKTFAHCPCRPGESPVPMRLVEDGVRRAWGEPPKKRERMEIDPPSGPGEFPALAIAAENTVAESIAEPVPFPKPDEPPAPSES